MNTEKLRIAILKGTWGNIVAANDNFYRLLFKLEKKRMLTLAEVHELFASYKNWTVQIEQLVKDCKGNDTMEDRRAVMYAETLEDDIIHHIESIVTTIKCEDETLLTRLAEQAEEAIAMQQ